MKTIKQLRNEIEASLKGEQCEYYLMLEEDSGEDFSNDMRMFEFLERVLQTVVGEMKQYHNDPLPLADILHKLGMDILHAEYRKLREETK